MATHDNNYIIRYIEGDLSPEEQEQFEAALQSDAPLAIRVSQCRELMSTLRQRLPQDDTAIALRQSLRELNRVHFKPEAKLVSFKRYYTAIAAVAAVIVLAILLWPRESYIDRFGTTQMIASTERGDNADTLLQQAAVYFNQRQFDKALPLLEKAVKADSSNAMALFYRGVAQLHTGNMTAARHDLQQVYQGESVFRYEAAFNIALSHAQQENAAAAKEWLQKIPEGAPVSERAQQLLKKLP